MYDTNFERQMEEEQENAVEDKPRASMKVQILTFVTYTVTAIVSLAILALIIEAPIWLFQEITK